jgi:transmembrane sensor
MSEPKKSRLTVPLGDVLESGLSRAREERLWAHIRQRRGAKLGGHSEPPKAGMFLPAPLARTLRDADDLTNQRSQLWRKIQERRQSARRKPALRPAFALGFGVAAFAAFLLFVRPPTLFSHNEQALAAMPLSEASGAQVHTWSAGQTAHVVRLSDESEIRLEPGARIEPVLSTGTRFELLLSQGEAEFSVTPGGPRRWVIEAGLAKVEVVGTVFRVARGENSVRVSVARGTVLVKGDDVPGFVQKLTAGKALEVRPVRMAHARSRANEVPSATEAQASNELLEPEQEREAPSDVELPSAAAQRALAKPRARVRRRADQVSASWKAHVKEGRFAEAYAALGPEHFAEAAAHESNVEGLLSLADAARLSGHPGQAVLPLERVLQEFSQSPLAAVSAFTLGRVLLDQLHDPRTAAQAFERAIAMHPPHALLADCHARLVEAYSRAGDHASARRAASRYRTLFPSGRHNVDVEAWTHQ